MEKDVFDEFEFKPLTEGLGFHKKTINLREKLGESEIIPNRLTVGIPKRPPEKTEDLLELAFEQTLPRETVAPSSKTSVASNATINHDLDKLIESLREPEIKKPFDLPNYQPKYQAPENVVPKASLAKLDFAAPVLEEPVVKTRLQKEEVIVASLPSAMGGLVDGLVIAALTLMSLIVMLVTIKVDLVANIYHSEGSGLLLSLAALIVGVAWMYSTAARVFAFATIGDWVVDQEIGTEAERESEFFSLKVAARFAINAATGFIIFPVISYFIGKDLLGSLVGATMIERKLV